LSYCHCARYWSRRVLKSVRPGPVVVVVEVVFCEAVALAVRIVVALVSAYAVYDKLPTIVLGKSIARAKKRIVHLQF
jgi:hypothetical protein